VQHIATQGSTVATLQARVGELGRVVDGGHKMYRDLERVLAEKNAEVERLKAEKVGWATELEQRAMSAESRLAAIREKTTAQLEATRRAIAAEKIKPRPSQAHIAEFQMAEVALEPLAKMLEGDASQEAKHACCVTFTAGLVGQPQQTTIAEYPCCPTCTHDDAATPGHPERVKERSVEVAALIGFAPAVPENENAEACDHGVPGERECEECDADDPWLQGGEAMRAACWEAVDEVLTINGLAGPGRAPLWDAIKAAIEGAAP
jgi:hypothetical protein